MATRKKGKKKKKSGGKRMGGIKFKPDSPIVLLGSVAAGTFLVGKPINEGIDKMLAKISKTTIDGKLIAAGEGGLGAALAFIKFGKGRRSYFQTVPGGIMIGAGLRRLLVEFGVMNGYRVGAIPGGGYKEVNVIGNSLSSGYGNVNVIGGYKVPGQLNGYTVGKSRMPLSSKIMGNIGLRPRHRLAA